MPKANAQLLAEIGERIRERVAARRCEEESAITVSLGGATAGGEVPAAALLDAADRALMSVKHSGKDGLEVAQGFEHQPTGRSPSRRLLLSRSASSYPVPLLALLKSRVEDETKLTPGPSDLVDTRGDPGHAQFLADFDTLVSRQPPGRDDLRSLPQFVGVRRRHRAQIIHNEG